MVTREMLERWAYSVGVTGQPMSRDLETEARAVIALCLAALDAREALNLALDFAPVPEAPIRNLLSHLDTGRAAAPEEGAP